MRLNYILFVFFSFYSVSAISSCEVPRNEELVIGCTYKCDFFYRLRLNLTALALKYPIRIVDLRYSKETIESVDGILVPGGEDIDPKYYLDSVTPELREYTLKNLDLVSFTSSGVKRDAFEYSVVKRYSSEEQFSRLPLLGVCRGMQMMTVAQGLPLYLDIKTELGIKNRKFLFDTIKVPKGDSLMRSIYGSMHFRGFKQHHQGLRVPYYLEHKDEYPQVRVTAYSNHNQIAEALEYTHRPALGVQYHPEKSLFRTSGPVIKWFLKKACEYKNSMKENL